MCVSFAGITLTEKVSQAAKRTLFTHKTQRSSPRVVGVYTKRPQQKIWHKDPWCGSYEGNKSTVANAGKTTLSTSNTPLVCAYLCVDAVLPATDRSAMHQRWTLSEGFGFIGRLGRLRGVKQRSLDQLVSRGGLFLDLGGFAERRVPRDRSQPPLRYGGEVLSG